MSKIDEKFLQQLRDRDLYVSDPFPSDHVLAEGVWIAKPSAVNGNSVDGYNGAIGDMKIDAPEVLLRHTNEGWVVLNQEHVPAMGEGDFKNVWQSPQEAIDDIVDFYFGNKARMNVINERVSRNRAIKGREGKIN